MAHSTLAEIRRIRIDKAAELRQLGIDPYPSKSSRDHYAAPIISDFDSYDNKTVTVGGRLMSWRKQGGMAFGHILDQSGRIQLLIRRETLGETKPEQGAIGFNDLRLLDLGDLVEGTGRVMKSKRGEISIELTELRLLAKTLRPLPDQWSGLKDRELILRKRYLDTILEPSSHHRFDIIARMVACIREFLNSRGFVEFQTPVIQPQYGGGTAKPFRTYVNVLDADMFLAISHELYLKRLIVAGYDKVYTIGRYFRNEGIDRSHHPEFSMVETMAAYQNYEYNMDLVEDMFRHIAVTVFGRTQFKVREHTIDFGPAWRRVRMVDLVKEITGVDFSALTSAAEANVAVKSLGIGEEATSVGHGLVLAFETHCEKSLVQPTLVYGQPMEISPLAKPLAADPRWAERFEIFIAGMECGDNWSEQNDPIQLLETWRRSYNPEEAESGNVHALDFDFVEALEHGMPPTTGIGPGIERMAMIFTEQENIDDVIFFPMRRPSISALNEEIFGLQPPPKSPTTAPVVPQQANDLALQVEEFESMCHDGVIRPSTHKLTITPHLRIWRIASPSGRPRASGHVTISGFLQASMLHIAGYRVVPEEPLTIETETRRFTELIDCALVSFLRKTFPECQLEVRPVAVAPHAGDK